MRSARSKMPAPGSFSDCQSATCAASSAGSTSHPVTAHRPPYARSRAWRKAACRGRRSRSAFLISATGVLMSSGCSSSQRTTSAGPSGPS